MTEAEARQRLERMVAHLEVPTLTTAEVDDLVVLAKREDSAGLGYNESGWVETWNLGAAAAEGWRWKASKVAGHYDFSADGSSLSKSQAYEHCLRMAEIYSKAGGRGTMQLAGPAGVDSVIGNLD